MAEIHFTLDQLIRQLTSEYTSAFAVVYDYMGAYFARSILDSKA